MGEKSLCDFGEVCLLPESDIRRRQAHRESRSVNLDRAGKQLTSPNVDNLSSKMNRQLASDNTPCCDKLEKY